MMTREERAFVALREIEILWVIARAKATETPITEPPGMRRSGTSSPLSPP